ncbi:MAG: crotonase/enoyl-CoA hydratase family protein [Actinobacteria bacterium]|nr:crotonase/enoyl-CoA hydratase family protein [Actinomycetota bacterium]
MTTAAGLPASVRVEVDGEVLVVLVDRPHKRNAIDDETILGLERVFLDPPDGVRAAVLAGVGDHFCAGLDLSSLGETSVVEGVHHSRMWHRVTQAIQLGRLPVVSVLRGAVIGGGLELASATHLRVAEPSAFYALPEGQRGIFVGGGASVRLPRLIGVARMTDLMLTGRVYDAAEGHAAGLTQYLVAEGEGMTTGLELARRAASVAPVTLFAVLQALPRIADAGPQEGYLLESLMAAVAQGSDEAKERMQAFLAGRAAKVTDTPAVGGAR